MRIRGFLIPVFILASLTQEGSASRSLTAPRTCPVTLPTDSSFIPPYPYAPLAPFANRFWYGSDELWAMPSSDGLWAGVESPEGVFDKVFWWSTEWDWRTDHGPDLAVTLRSLDGSVPPRTTFGATNAHNKDDIQHAMLVGLGIPARGCWEITGTYKGQRLSYVVWLP